MKFFIVFLLLILLTGCAGSDVATNTNTNTTSTNVNAGPSEQLPEFPWPPNASAFTSIPSEILVKQSPAKLGDVDDRLRAALLQAGYENPGYYGIPGGFVVVTPLEQFDVKTGAPLDGVARWSTSPAPPALFTAEYFRALIKGTSGHFRVLAFAVTDKPFTRSGKEVAASQAAKLSAKGSNSLPSDMRQQEYTENFQCSAFVYEFLQSNSGQAKFVVNSGLLASQHLQKILTNLQRQ